MSQELTPETQGQESTSASTTTATPTSSGGGGGSGGSGRAGLRGLGFDAQVAALTPPDGPVQRKGAGGGGDVRAAAAHGISGGGGALPFASQIQKSFGGYDISNVQAHTDSAAAAGSAAMGADAYATGNHVAFGGAPDLHTAAHEAAHVVQQKAGVSLSGGVGQAGDPYEVHADRVADAVVAGQSAEPILAQMAGAPGGGGGVQQQAVQHKKKDRNKPKNTPKTGGGQTPNDQEQKTDPAAETTTPDEKASVSDDTRQSVLKRLEEDVQAAADALRAKVDAFVAAGVDDPQVVAVKKWLDDEIASYITPARQRFGKTDPSDPLSTEDVSDTNELVDVFLDGANTRTTQLDDFVTTRSAELKATLDADFSPLSDKRDALLKRIEAAEALGLISATTRHRFSEFEIGHDEHVRNLAALPEGPARIKQLSDAVAFTQGAGAKLTDVETTLAAAIDRQIEVLNAELAIKELGPTEDDVFAKLATAENHLVVSLVLKEQMDAYRTAALGAVLAHKTVLENITVLKSGTTPVDPISAQAAAAVRTGRLREVTTDIERFPKLVADVIRLAGSYEDAVRAKAAEVTTSKGTAKAADPVVFEGQYETTRFGDETLSDDQTRLRQSLDTSLLILTEPVGDPQAIHDKLLLHIDRAAFDTAKTLDKQEVTTWTAAADKVTADGKKAKSDLGDATQLVPGATGANSPLALHDTLAVSMKAAEPGIAKGKQYDEGTHATAGAKVASETVSVKEFEARIPDFVALKNALVAHMSAFSSTEQDEAKWRDAALAHVDAGTTANFGGVVDVQKLGVSAADIKAAISTTPALRQVLVDLRIKTATPGFFTGTHDAKKLGDGEAVAGLLSPGAILGSAMKQKPATPAKLDEVGAFVTRYASRDDIRRDARSAPEVVSELSTMTEAMAALALEMFKSGKVMKVNTDPNSPAGEAVVTTKTEKDGAVVDVAAPLEVQLDFICRQKTTEPTFTDQWQRVKAQVAAFKASLENDLNEKEGKAGLNAENLTKFTAFHKKTAGHTKLIRFLDEHDATFLKEVFTPLIGLAAYAEKPAEEKAATDTTPPAPAAGDTDDTKKDGTEALPTPTYKYIGSPEKVRPGFTDESAEKIATNIFLAFELSDTGAQTHFGDAKASDTMGSAVDNLSAIAGDLSTFVKLVGLGSNGQVNAKNVGIVIRNLDFNERDAVSKAMKAKHGRVLKELIDANFKKGDATAKYAEKDANDPAAHLVWTLETLVKQNTKASAGKALMMIAEASQAERDSLLDDKHKTFLSTLHSFFKNRVSGKEYANADYLSDVLKGNRSLATAVAKHHGWFNDDEAGVEKDVEIQAKLLKTQLEGKYAAVLDPKHPEHEKQKAEFEGAYRAELIKLATDDDFLVAVQKFMGPAEIERLQALILGGGKDSDTESVLKVWRKKSYLVKMTDRDGIIAAVKALSDAQKAVVRDDHDVRLMIAEAFAGRESDQQLLFGLLEGKAMADPKKESGVGSWFKTLFGLEKGYEAKGVLAAVRSLSKSNWQRMRDDEALVLDILQSFSPENAAELRKLLKLSLTGYKQLDVQEFEALETPVDAGATKVADTSTTTDISKQTTDGHKKDPTPATEAKTPATLTSSDKKSQSYYFDQSKAIVLAAEDAKSILAEASRFFKLEALAEDGKTDLLKDVGAKLASDAAIVAHIKSKFGNHKRAPVTSAAAQAEEQKSGGDPSTFLSSVQSAFKRLIDPATAMMDFSVNGLTSSSDADGMKAAIEAAGPLAFLVQFTNLAGVVPALNAYVSAAAKHDKAVKDAEAAKQKQQTPDMSAVQAALDAMGAAHNQVREFDIGLEPTLAGNLKSKTSAKSFTVLKDACSARVKTILGSANLGTAPGKAVAVQALQTLAGGSAALQNAELAVAILGGTDLEARVLKMNEQNQTKNYKKSEANTELVAQMGSMGANLVDEKELGKMEKLKTQADEVQAAIDARRDLVVAAAKGIATTLVTTALTAINPAMGTVLAGKLILSLSTAVVGHGTEKIVKALQGRGEETAFFRELTLGLIPKLVSTVITDRLGVLGVVDSKGLLSKGVLSGVMGVFGEGPIAEGAAAVVDAYGKSVIDSLSKDISDPKKIAEAYNRGGLALAGQAMKSIKEAFVGVDVTKIPEAVVTAILKKTLETAIGEGSKAVFGEDAKETMKDNLTVSGSAVTVESIKEMAGAQGTAAITMACANMVSAGVHDLTVWSTDNAMYKVVSKYVKEGATARAVTALSQISGVVVTKGWGSVLPELGKVLEGTVDPRTYEVVKYLQSATTLSFVLDAMVAGNATVNAAFLTAWQRLQLAQTVVDAQKNTGNAAGAKDDALLKDIVSKEDKQVALASGYVTAYTKAQSKVAKDQLTGAALETKHLAFSYGEYSAEAMAAAETIATATAPAGNAEIKEKLVLQALKHIASNDFSPCMPVKTGKDEDPAKAKEAKEKKDKYLKGLKKAVEEKRDAEIAKLAVKPNPVPPAAK